MAELWYFTCEGKQMEPVTADELKQLASSGFLRATDMVWKEGMPAWSKAGDVPNLIPASAAASNVPVAKLSRGDEPVRSRPIDDDVDEPRPRRRRRPVDEDERAGEDAPRRRREPAKKGMSGLALTLIIGGVLVGVVGIIGGIIAYAVHVNTGKVISTYNVELKPNSSDSREFAFQFGTLYQFNVKSDRDTDVDLMIVNNMGQPVAGDWSFGPNSYLRWSPTVTGNYRVKLQNLDFGMGNRSWVTIRSMGSSRGPVGNGVPPPNFIPQPDNFPNPIPVVNIPPPVQLPIIGPTINVPIGIVPAGGQVDRVIMFPKTKRIEVALHSEVVDNDVDLFILDQKGAQIASDTSVGPNSRLSFQARAGQSYTFRVRNLGAQATNCTLTHSRP